jgi:hypothetical protein
MPHPSHSPLFEHPNNEPIIMQLFLVSCYLLPLAFLAPKTHTLRRRVQGFIPERRSIWVVILLQTGWPFFSLFFWVFIP